MCRDKLLIGWSRTDITPSARTLLMGQFHARLSRGTISPLTATALALETCPEEGAGEQAVFLSCDLAFDCFKPDLLEALEGRCEGLDLSKLTVHGTHTHTAPATERGMYEEPEDVEDFMNPDQYRLWLVDRLADAIEEAWEGRRPGGIRRGFGYAVVGRCRRAIYADGSAQMYGSVNREDFRGLEACDDHAVNMLFTCDREGELSGMIVNLACPSQCDESKEKYSADFWHELRERVREEFGASVHLLPQCAPAGDASPHLLMDQKEEADLRDRMGINDKEIIARRIITAVREGWSHASPLETSVAFQHEVKTLELPRLMVTEEEYEMEKRTHEMSEEERQQQPWGFRRIWPFGLICDLVARYEQQEENPTHEVECHVIRLGDVVFATNPFELYMDYGARIRGRSSALQTFLIQEADGSDNGFYLPTERALEGNHYSALIKSNWVGPEAGQMLVEETLESIDSLFAGEEYPRTR